VRKHQNNDVMYQQQPVSLIPLTETKCHYITVLQYAGWQKHSTGHPYILA